MKRAKRLLAFVIVLVMLLGMLPVSAQNAPRSMTAFFVSPDGSDAFSGTSAEEPFATLERARDEVRRINKDMTGDILVYLMDGTWELSQTFCLDERDSGTNGYYVRYLAMPGAKVILSGGKKLDGDWEVASEVNWLSGGLKAYKTHLERDSKLRAIYVDDQRAAMTRKTLRPKRSVGSYSIRAGQADWAWVSGSKPSGNVFNSSDLPANTRNPRNIELESGSTWVKAMVCADSLQSLSGGETQVNFQMPYAAIAQSLGWNCNYNPTAGNDVTNVYEWLSKAGEFYFDQAGSTLYYIPEAGQTMEGREVIVPELEQLVNIAGSTPMKDYAENITFEGIKFAYTDWNLYEVAGSYGNATHQAATVITAYADTDWHNDLYRAYDVPTAAILVNNAKGIRFIGNEISNTGYLGIHLENDVWNCEITGNYIARTGGGGIVIGHPQHIYENDTARHRVGNGAGPEKEKFPAGTESVPKHITISNNYLLENCYFFPGNSPITSFFTYDMKVLNNFVYKCSYSGMSIGWAWCEFDGTASSKLPGLPTTTSRANTVSNNRVEEICSILQDAGGIYTLGQQGNEDWTDVTVMNGNYINAKRARQNADGSRMVNGFHPDEGSAYITMDANVVTNIIRNVYELNDWKRKHDVIVTNGFSNTDRSETTAPNCKVEQYVNSDYIWPLLGYNTVLNSGLSDEWVYLVGKDVIADTEYELASNVQMEAGMRLPRRGLLYEKDTVWIAPAGTRVFSEGPTMTCAAGNEKSILLPQTTGQYKLYIVYEDGTVSAASQNTVYVGEAKGIASVAEGMRYSVSAGKPLTLSLNTDTYRFTLNGRSVKSGDSISEAGEWTLGFTPIGSADAPEEIRFSTFVSEANRLLPRNQTVRSGETIRFAGTLGDPDLRVWLASRSASAFAESPSMTCAAGDDLSIAAPVEEGVYDLAVVDRDGKILSRSDATVTVSNATVPVTGYIMNFAADQGVTESGGLVSAWQNTADDRSLTQSDSAKRPKVQYTEKGMPYLHFGGSQTLALNGVNFNDLEGLTILLMSRNARSDYDRATFGQGNGDRFSPFYVSETADWSGLYLTPYQDWIGVRFGTSVTNCFIKTQRTANTDVSVVGTVKNGASEKIFDDGKLLFTQNGQAQKTKNIGSKLSIGYSYSGGDTYFEGDIYEIFVYDRALSDDEVAAMTDYLFTKYKLRECAHDYDSAVTAPTCTVKGYTAYTCRKCGAVYVDDEVPALGHNYVNYICTRCGAPDPNAKHEDICPSSSFADAPAYGSWAHEGIDYCIDREYMNGTGNGLFSPDGDVTRAQLVTIIYRIEGQPEIAYQGTFTDVEDGLWYSRAIEWAAANGIVNGVGEGRFDPAGAITREQIATIFFRYAGASEGEGGLEKFPDHADAHGFAVPALSWAVEKGIINGVSADGVTCLRPLSNATRAQIASIIMRFIEA